MTATKPYASAEYLGIDEAVAEYLASAVEEGDAALFRHALGVVACARHDTDRAGDLKALNVRLTAMPVAVEQAAGR